jgi:hypothetical protein
MNSLVFEKNVTRPAMKYAPPSVLRRQATRGKVPRLRRKDPSWTGLALAVLVADVALAALAWVAVGFVLN